MEYDLSVVLLEGMKKEGVLVDEMTRAMTRGGDVSAPTNWRLSLIDTHSLQAIIQQVKNAAPKTGKALSTLQEASALLSVRSALKNQEWDNLSIALDNASGLKIPSATKEVTAAQQKLAYVKQVDELHTQLQGAMDAMNETIIQR